MLHNTSITAHDTGCSWLHDTSCSWLHDTSITLTILVVTGSTILYRAHNTGCCMLTSEGKDLSQLNQLARGQWRNMVAVLLLKPLTTPFTKLLSSYLPSATHVVSGRIIIYTCTAVVCHCTCTMYHYTLAIITGMNFRVLHQKNHVN